MSSFFSAAQLQEAVDRAFYDHYQNQTGQNADYIPFLANVPSEQCAISLVTAEGAVYQAGDHATPFAIESVSKIFTLALLLDDIGPDSVREKIGAEPTGLPFNSIQALTEHHDKPLTPLVNAGAIATVSLLNATDEAERWQRIHHYFNRLAGRDIALSDALNQSEQSTNFHNRAIAWLLYAAGNCYCDPMEACKVYTQQCSLMISCNDLATMGACLALDGRHPHTQERVLTAGYARYVLAQMTMEGLYDHSGDWFYQVGLPAKSGVGGGIVAVVPGQMAIAAYSSPLDSYGNSVRAQQMITTVASALSLDLLK
ncbi:glutaminase A [Vibrio sp. SM6]|uniref:Glutaminase n=1 Tax=Vibrio agarilyticus TaxID=2726741 RepID=A0A7X8TRX1_9VIBR|nr:glutaminase A [Vibrio agarilyticus]NLS13108.1 glutaminase A [Vibrio agarilyticus]